jgi:fructose-bisphosphate aldolase class I
MTLQDIAKQLVAPKKGILAADESTGTIQKRFESIGVESTENTRRAYRELLFSTEGVEEYISGVILYDETLRQSALNGTPFPKFLQDKGIFPGIKVDMKTHDLAGAPGEQITEGLDGLRGRLKEYKELGAAFAKWRAVYSITDELPSDYCMHVNAHALARYAALCQEQGIVPIVEPEVLMDGSHTIERCYEVTKQVLIRVFDELKKQQVHLKGMLLKPNMVISGTDAAEQADEKTVAEETVRCFRETVPEDVPGIVFLSGGQSEQQACENLDVMNKIGSHPWELSFSYGRALQSTALKTWGGKDDRVSTAQDAFLHRATLVSAARSGTYDKSMETI